MTGPPKRVFKRGELNALFKGGRPPTPDDVSITKDGRRLDTKEKVLEFLAELDEKRKAEAAVEVSALTLLLSDSLTPDGVLQWLHAQNRLLDGERPIDLLHAGEFDHVRQAAEAFINGSYV